MAQAELLPAVTVRRFLLVVTAAVVGLLLELRAIHAYVVGVTHILQNVGVRSAQTARPASSDGAGE